MTRRKRQKEQREILSPANNSSCPTIKHPKTRHKVYKLTASVEATLQSLFILLGVHSNSGASKSVLPFVEAHYLEMMVADILNRDC